MKTNINRLINITLQSSLILIMAILPVACLEDKGNYDYLELMEFRVDTVGVNQRLAVQQFNTLHVPSHLVYAGNKSELTYTWSLYKSGTGQNDNPSILLSTTEDFNEQITAKPGNYVLEFIAKNTNTGEIAGNRYTLTVESIVGIGLLVLYDKGGQADIDIVRTPVLNTALTSSSITRNSYTKVNNTLIKGQARQLVYTSNYIYVFTDKTAIRLSNEDMTQLDDFNSMFFHAPEVEAPNHYGRLGFNSSNEILINNGQVHFIALGNDNGKHYFPEPKIMQGDTYYAEAGTTVWGSGPFCFDSKGHRFIWCGLWSGEFLPCTDARLLNVNLDIVALYTGFRPNTNGSNAYAFFKNPSDSSKRTMMVIDATVNSSATVLLADIDISGCPEASEMQDIITTPNSPMFYYRSNKSVYVCPFSIDQAVCTPPSTPLFTCGANETVTDIQLLNGNKILAISTWDGTEGKLQLFNTDIASGVTDSTPLETFNGFGKIVDIQYKNAQ